MKYVVATIVCTMAGVGIFQLNADGREYGFYGDTYRNPMSPGNEYVLKAHVWCQQQSTGDTVVADTDCSDDDHFFKFSISGDEGHSWHRYIPNGYYYRFWARKDSEGGYWHSDTTDWIYYSGNSENVDRSLEWYDE